jgi:hypothetical protein
MTHFLVNHPIIGHLTPQSLKCRAIDNPTSCKIHAVTHVLHTKNMSAAEIHCEICTVYGQNVTIEGTVRQWCRNVQRWVNKCS